MVGKGSLPNAIDAVILCNYLGVGVEEVFGPDAVEQLRHSLKTRHKVATPDEAAQRALDTALNEVRETEQRVRPGPSKGRGRSRKTG